MPSFSTSEIRDRYQRIARYYDRSLILLRMCGFRERHYRRRAVAALALRPGDTVIDLGCGTGRNFPLLRAAVGPEGRVIGVDLTDAMLSEARQRVRANGWENIELVEADAASYLFPARTNGILSTFAVTLAPGYDDILRRAAGALVPGGRLAVMDLKLPERWPHWLVRLAAWANRPYGVTVELGSRHPWESIRRYTREVLFREFYFGGLYLSVGESHGRPETGAHRARGSTEERILAFTLAGHDHG